MLAVNLLSLNVQPQLAYQLLYDSFDAETRPDLESCGQLMVGNNHEKELVSLPEVLKDKT